MNPTLITSIILTIVGGFLAITGSVFFWVILVIFPIFIGIRIFKIPFIDNLFPSLAFIGGGFIFLSFFFPIGQIITFLYLFLIIVLIGKIIFKDPIYSINIFFIAIVISAIFSIFIGILMESYIKKNISLTQAKVTDSQTGTTQSIKSYPVNQSQKNISLTQAKELNDIISRAKAAKYVVIDLINAPFNLENTINNLYSVHRTGPIIHLNEFSSDFIPTFNVGSSIEKIHRSQVEEYFFNPQKFPITDYCVTITPLPENQGVIQEYSKCTLRLKSSNTIVPLSQYYQ